MRVERCLIGNAILGCDFDIKLELSDEALLVPQPNDKAVIWLSSLHKIHSRDEFISYIRQIKLKQMLEHLRE